MENALQHTKKGDTVLITGYLDPQLATVDRTTPTQIILADLQKFHRSSGMRVGASSSFIRSSISVPSAKTIEKHIFMQALRDFKGRVAKLNPSDATVPELISLSAILSELEKKCHAG